MQTADVEVHKTFAVSTPVHPPIWTAEQIVCILRAHSAELRQLGVRRIALFGSFKHDTCDTDSDLDLLVTLARPSFDRYMALRFFLEDLFARDVDLVLENGLNPALRDLILPDCLPVDLT